MNQLAAALLRGTAANVASIAALATFGKRETGSSLAGVNAVSHWLWGDADARRNDFSWRHTVVGALTNELASVFWAFCFERLFAARARNVSAPKLVSEAAATSALAFAVDYGITPKRLTPGYELRLSRPSLFAVYVAFAGGLALGSLLFPSDRR